MDRHMLLVQIKSTTLVDWNIVKLEVLESDSMMFSPGFRSAPAVMGILSININVWRLHPKVTGALNSPEAVVRLLAV